MTSGIAALISRRTENPLALRHGEVQQHKVGFGFSDQSDGLQAVLSLSGDFVLGLERQHGLQPLPKQAGDPPR
ncbi:MAG: hypothetical protein MZV70_76290 [Desulfobacterales bacterium]|nr:hypothetical protein [Desulfobacterales bacterium]